MNRSSHNLPITDRLAALGEMVRLRLLRLLEKEELSVGELARVVQLPQSTVSRHLKVLSDGGWLVKRSEGTATLYRLVLDDMDAANRSLWTTVRDQLTAEQTAEMAEDVRRLGSVIAERMADSQSFFGRVVGQWDDLRSQLFGDRATFQSLLSLLPRDWVVADLGCGTGNAAELLAPNVSRVYAIDQSTPMLRAAKKRLAGLENVELRRGEITAIPLEDSSVNAAVCALVLHHLVDPKTALREAKRILKPGGTVLVVDMVEHDRVSYKHTMGHRWLGFSKRQMESLLGDVGFEGVRYQELAGHPEAKGPGLFACTAFASAVRT